MINQPAADLLFWRFRGSKIENLDKILESYLTWADLDNEGMPSRLIFISNFHVENPTSFINKLRVSL